MVDKSKFLPPHTAGQNKVLLDYTQGVLERLQASKNAAVTPEERSIFDFMRGKASGGHTK
jgi:hypothetical protein